MHMEAAKEEPVEIKPRVSLIEKIPPLDGPVVTVAVYGFADKTGQLKPNDKLAVFSKAVTQGAEVFLIKSLKDVPGWFRVVERVGLDNLIFAISVKVPQIDTHAPNIHSVSRCDCLVAAK